MPQAIECQSKCRNVNVGISQEDVREGSLRHDVALLRRMGYRQTLQSPQKGVYCSVSRKADERYLDGRNDKHDGELSIHTHPVHPL